MRTRKLPSRNNEPTRGRAGGTSRAQPLLGEIVGIDDARHGRVRLSDRRDVHAQLPMHVNPSWLAAAVAVAPVKAALLREGSSYFVSGLYPGPEHADVSAEVRIEGTKIVLRAGKAHVELVEDQVRVRGNEIQSRATGEHWVLGARVRIN